MAEVERIDIVKLTISSEEFRTITWALRVAYEGEHMPTRVEDARARALFQEFDGQ